METTTGIKRAALASLIALIVTAIGFLTDSGFVQGLGIFGLVIVFAISIGDL